MSGGFLFRRWSYGITTSPVGKADEVLPAMTNPNSESTNLARARAYVAAVERGADAAEMAGFLHPDAVAEAFHQAGSGQA